MIGRRKTLENAFVPFGDVRTVEIPLDLKTWKNSGFGFVEYMEIDDAKAAIDNMRGMETHGRTLRVNIVGAASNKPSQASNRPIWADDIFYRKRSQVERLSVEDAALDG